MPMPPFYTPDRPVDPPDPAPVYEVRAKAWIVLKVDVFHDFEGRSDAHVEDVLHETIR